MQDDNYHPYRDESPFELPHSGPGLASFFVAILAWILVVGGSGVAGFLASKQPGGQPPQDQMLIAGFAIMGGMGLFVVGAILGLVGVLLPNRKKVFAILGLVFSLLPAVGCAGLISLAVVGAAR